MPLIYHDPKTVTSPRDYVDNVRVIYNGGANSFSLAKLEWEGDEVFAIRWNVARREHDDPAKQSGKVMCVGMPSSRGVPVWFVIPLIELLDKKGEVYEKIQSFLE